MYINFLLNNTRSKFPSWEDDIDYGATQQFRKCLKEAVKYTLKSCQWKRAELLNVGIGHLWILSMY